VTVVGLLEPNDLSEPYWFGRTDRFVNDTTSWDTYPFWVPEATVVETLAGYLTDMDSTLETYGLVDIDKINARNARQVEERMKAFDFAMREGVSGAITESKLGQIVGDYRTKLFFTRLPLFALMLQVVGIAIYYLVMVSTMLVERQAGEIALLRSRGGSPMQVVAIYAIEGLLVCGFAAIAGPFIASAGIGILGYTPPFESLSGNARLDVPLSRGAFGLAAGGAAMAFLALLFPAWRAARNSTIDYKHSLARPQTQPVFLRYYLDLVLVGIGAFLFYPLRERGSLVTERLFGDLSADPLLLLSPTLFMLMVALVFLRLFPVVLRVAAWGTRRFDSATMALGLSRMTRAPMHYSRLILLLLLATAVGMFAAGYRATLERGYDDRSAFEAGAPSRLESVRSPANLSIDTFVTRVKAATGADVVTPVARQQGSYSMSTFRSLTVTLLGVVPGEFERSPTGATTSLVRRSANCWSGCRSAMLSARRRRRFRPGRGTSACGRNSRLRNSRLASAYGCAMHPGSCGSTRWTRRLSPARMAGASSWPTWPGPYSSALTPRWSFRFRRQKRSSRSTCGRRVRSPRCRCASRCWWMTSRSLRTRSCRRTYSPPGLRTAR